MANKIPVSYLQTDSRWKNVDYSASGESTTIGASGCGPSCMAMVIATLKNSDVTPLTTCNWAKANGYKAKDQGTYYSYFTPQGKVYDINVSQMNYSDLRYLSTAATYHSQMVAALKNGKYVIACMGPGNWTSGGHFILLYDYQDGQILIRDPNSTAVGRIKAAESLVKSQVKYYFVVNENCMEEPDMTEAQTRTLFKEILAGEDTTNDPYSEKAWSEAVESKLTTGERPKGYAQRQEVIVQMAALKKQILEEIK